MRGDSHHEVLVPVRDKAARGLQPLLTVLDYSLGPDSSIKRNPTSFAQVSMWEERKACGEWSMFTAVRITGCLKDGKFLVKVIVSYFVNLLSPMTVEGCLHAGWIVGFLLRSQM